MKAVNPFTTRAHMQELITYRQLEAELFRKEAMQGLDTFYSSELHVIVQERLRHKDAVNRALLAAYSRPATREIENENLYNKMSASQFARYISDDFNAKGVLIANDMLTALHVYQKNGFLPAPVYPLKPVIAPKRKQ